jgi:hypothetical protein
MTAYSTPASQQAGRHRRYTITVVDAGVVDDELCLEYEIAPVPASLIDDTRLHEGHDVGVAVDGHRHVVHGGRSAYRVAGDGSRVVGVLKLGPSTWPDLGVVRVLFAPFAHSAGLSRILCEARLIIEGSTVRRMSVRRA